VIRVLLLAQVANASNEGVMAIALSPLDCLSLRLEGREDMIGMILDDVILDRFSLTAAFRAGLNVNIRHVLPPLSFCAKDGYTGAYPVRQVRYQTRP
jgi:hypothetical protein